jgi:hypothetical protein
VAGPNGDPLSGKHRADGTVGQDSIIWLALSGFYAFNRRQDFSHMFGFFSYIVGSLVDIVRYISHAVIIVFHNVVLLAVVVAFLYGIFRLCRYGLQYLWRLRGGGPPGQSAPKDKPEDSPE